MEKNTKKPEIRTTPCRLMVREANTGAEGDGAVSRTITGTAIVFDQPFDSQDWRGNTYREMIAKSAVTSDFLKSQDIKMNLLHNRRDTLARWNRGEGNLKVWVEDDGVKFEFEAPACDLGDRCLALVRAGVYSGCSFEFWPKDYEVKEEQITDGKKLITVTHVAFESIDALTVAMDPAYEQTSVSVDELREKIPQFAERLAKKREDRQRQRDLADAEAAARQREIFNNTNNNLQTFVK